MPGLEIGLKPIDGQSEAALAEMSGAIDGNTVASFQQTLEEIKTKGIRRLVLDMSKIKYVNSTGLGSLVKYADAFKSNGGGMALIKVPAKVKIVIEMLGLNAFFDICGDLDQALAALEKAGGAAPAPAAPSGPPRAQKGPPSGATPAQRAQPSPPPPPPPPPAAAAAAPAVTQTGRLKRPGGAPGAGFPVVVPCGQCGVQIEFKDAGNWKCPRCHAQAVVKGDGNARFARPDRASPITLTLSASPDCSAGLLQLVTSVCQSAFNGGNLEAVRTAVSELTFVMEQSVYAGNPNGVYHVSIDRVPGRVVIRAADAGATIDTTRVGQYFPQASRSMDEFDCRPHPTGGNLIRMVKKG